MQNKAERTLRRTWVTILCIAVILILPLLFRKSLEEQIDTLVSNNLEFLNECIASQTYDRVYELKDVKKVKSYAAADGGLYIEFYCHDFGIAPSSAEWGFYYVSDDKPTGYQSTPMELDWDGKDQGWRAQPQGNSYYTKKITDHWYYYKMAF